MTRYGIFSVPSVTSADDSTIGDGSISTFSLRSDARGRAGSPLPSGSLFLRANTNGRISLKNKKVRSVSSSAGSSSSVASGGTCRDSVVSQVSRASRASRSVASSRATRRSRRHPRVAGGAAAKLMLTGAPRGAVVTTPEKLKVRRTQVVGTPSTAASSTFDDDTPSLRSISRVSSREELHQGVNRSLSVEFSDAGDVELVDSDIEFCDGDNGDDSSIDLPTDRYGCLDADPDPEENQGVRRKVKEEWAKGTARNRRYSNARSPEKDATEKEEDETEDEAQQERSSEASLPSILQRNSAFHLDAASAITSLLRPTTGSGTGGQQLLPPPCRASPRTVKDKDFHPGNNGEVILTSSKTFTDDSSTEIPVDPDSSLIDEKTEAFFSSLQRRMTDPPKQLSGLLCAIARPQNTKGRMDRGYMVRRKNACGALKVLTSNRSNIHVIAWTTGVLTALTSVLEDAGEAGPDVTFSNPATRAAYIEAHKRAMATLLNLVVSTKNRVLMFHSPGLVRALCRVLAQDKGESLYGCCMILGYLSKTVANRLLMVKVPGLLGALEWVIRPSAGSSAGVEPERAGKNASQETNSFGVDTLVSTSFSGSNSESDSGSGSDCSSHQSDDDSHSLSNGDGSSHSLYSSDGSFEKYSTTFDEGGDGNVEPNSECPTPIRGAAHAMRKKSLPKPAPVKADTHDNNESNRFWESNIFLNGARQNIFAVLLHLVKERDNTYCMARNEALVATLVDIANMHNSPLHTHAITVLAHLTRHSDNSMNFVFHIKNFVSTLIHGISSESDDTRKYSCLALQNLSFDKTCRQEIANAHGALSALCSSSCRAGHEEEQLGAMRALKNLSDEPANLIPMTNVSDCVGTLMQIASNRDGQNVSLLLQYLACDTLTMLSHWLRRIATSGMGMEDDNEGGSDDDDGDSAGKAQHLFVPSIKVTQYQQWI